MAHRLPRLELPKVSSIIAAFVAAKPTGFTNAEATLYACLGRLIFGETHQNP